MSLMSEQLHPDVFWALVWAFVFIAAGAAGICWSIGTLLNERSAARAKKRRELVHQRQAELWRRRMAAAAPTRVFKDADIAGLRHQIDDQTALLREVDPTALPKRPKVHTGRRWLR